MNRKTSGPAALPGISSLFVVLLVLILAVFSVLSLSTAKSDASMSRKLAERKIAYYTAVSRFEETLSGIDRILKETDALPDASLLDSKIRILPPEADDGEEVLGYALWTEEAGENTLLSVCICLEKRTDAHPARIVVLSCANVYAGEYDPDDTLNLLQRR